MPKFLTNTVPTAFSFGGTGVPVVLGDVCPQLSVSYPGVATRLTLTCKTAPTGNFQVTIQRSPSGGGAFVTLGTVTIGTGNRLATTTSLGSTVLSAGDVLKCNVDSVNGAADWTVRIDVLVRN